MYVAAAMLDPAEAHLAAAHMQRVGEELAGRLVRRADDALPLAGIGSSGALAAALAAGD